MGRVINRQLVVVVYTLASVVGTSLFLGYGIRDTSNMSELHSLSHLITATHALDTGFFYFMIFHGLLGAFVYYGLIAHGWWQMFFAIFIPTSQTLTGAFNTTSYSDPHYAYAVLAFVSTLAAAIAALCLRDSGDDVPITRNASRIAMAWCLVGLAAALLLSFGIIVQLSCCTFEGPFEWAAMYLIAFIPMTIYERPRALHKLEW